MSGSAGQRLTRCALDGCPSARVVGGALRCRERTLERFSIQAMARAIQPFGTEFDGDTLFAVSTSEVKQDSISAVDLGTLASEVAWDAILASAPVLPARAARSEIRICAADRESTRLN